jgi:octaprenyl-diphosphate synthase
LTTLKEIKQPVKKELEAFEVYFQKAMRTKVPLLSIITNYIYRRKGKQLRPLLVFLTAGMTGGIKESTYVAAGMIELLHTATLIHDDVVDEAYERRGSFSINALWRSKVAVLVGDFLLSKGLLLAIETNEFELLRNMSEAVKEMSEGELLQIERSRKMDIDETTYFDIIRKKTATLISSCTVNGATSSGASAENIEKTREIGMNLGMAFQLRDDIFDYQTKGILGKPIGNDIKEKKLTLPLIYALGKANSSTQSQVIKLVKKSRHDAKSLSDVINFVQVANGIDYAEAKMLEYRDKAKEIIKQFPSSSYNQSLFQLAEFITNRNQ